MNQCLSGAPQNKQNLAQVIGSKGGSIKSLPESQTILLGGRMTERSNFQRQQMHVLSDVQELLLGDVWLLI